MGSKPKPSSWPGRLLREGAPFLAPGLIAAALLFALPSDSSSQGKPKGTREKTGPALVCGEWHRGAGLTTALDLGEIKRAYDGLKGRVAQALDRQSDVPPPDPGRPYDAGLPACRADATRTESLPVLRGARVRGRTLYFLSSSGVGQLALPPEVERTPGAEILIVKARSLKDLPAIAERLGRPVSLASAEFARALGVRCGSTWLKISEKGDGIELHELR